jgi:hypothetical protein
MRIVYGVNIIIGAYIDPDISERSFDYAQGFTWFIKRELYLQQIDLMIYMYDLTLAIDENGGVVSLVVLLFCEPETKPYLKFCSQTAEEI